MPKKYTNQLLSGEGGEALISLRASQMGHVYHRRPGPDAGIDGQLELRDPQTQEATNKLLLVQSKARAAFPGEDDRRFYYAASQADIEYWLQADLPVILVCSHPEEEEAWWRNVTEWGRDPERRESRQIHFDKRRHRFDESAAEELLRLGVPDAPQIVVRRTQERLVSNLLEVASFPPTIYIAPTSITSLQQAWHRLRANNRRGSGWVLHDRSVLSFHDLSQPPFNVLTLGPPEAFSTEEWANTSNEDDRGVFVQLLNQTLRDMHHEDLKFEGSFAYFKSDGGERREPSKTRKGRTVVKGVERMRGDGHYAYRHMAASLRFLRLEGAWYLSIRPDYHYTHDGFGKSRYDSELTEGLKRRERNPAVRQQVQFWASFLSPAPTLLDPQGSVGPRITFGELLEVVVDRAFEERTGDGPDSDPIDGQESLW